MQPNAKQGFFNYAPLEKNANSKEVNPMKNQPKAKFKAGSVVATIWENPVTGSDATYKSVTFSRHYKDKQGHWQSSNILRQGDLPKAQLVLSKAFEYLTMPDTELVEVSN